MLVVGTEKNSQTAFLLSESERIAPATNSNMSATIFGLSTATPYATLAFSSTVKS